MIAPIDNGSNGSNESIEKIKRNSPTFRMKLESVPDGDGCDSGIIQGFASTFGNVDSDYETFKRGAFKETLIDNGGKVPILDTHDRFEPIGIGLEAKETRNGLWIKGQLLIHDMPRARAKFAYIKKAIELGAKAGLSVGFRPLEWITHEPKDDGDPRRLVEFTKVELREYSFAVFPANTEARVLDAKNEKDLFEQGNLIEYAEKALDTAEIFIGRGYQCTESERLTLIELSESLRALVEPSLDHDIDTLQAVQSLTDTIRASVKSV